ncbi:GntR family transcriptional regulator [Novosphingobium barchaimii]
MSKNRGQAPVSVEELCTQFGVSRQPVMEAMRRLSGDGSVAKIGGSQR